MQGDAIDRIEENAVRTIPTLTILRWIVQLGFGIILLWWIVRWVDVDSERLWTAVGKASPLDLALAVVFFVISIGLKTMQFRICLSSNVSNKYLFGLLLSQNALLTILPWRIGEISLPLLLRRNQDVPLTKSVSNILMIRLIDFAFIIVVAAATSGPKIRIYVSWVTLFVIVVILGSLFYAAKLVFRRVPTLKFVIAISVAFKSLSNPTTVGSIVLFSAGVFAMTTLQSAFALRAFGLTIPLLEVAILNAASLLVAVLPLHPPGGWGTIDLIQVVLLHQLNFQPEITTPVILVTHCFYTLLVLLGGGFGWWLCRNISHR